METEHKLYNEWTYWFDGFSNKSSEKYGTKIVEIGKCESAEEFWGIYDALPKLATMEVGSDISLFKKNIKPLWEDDGNRGGGRLTILLSNVNNENAQQYWRDTVCFFIQLLFLSYNHFYYNHLYQNEREIEY